jgi:hypothetical protein
MDSIKDWLLLTNTCPYNQNMRVLDKSLPLQAQYMTNFAMVVLVFRILVVLLDLEGNELFLAF